MLLASKTLDKINACLEADQGNKYRELLKSLLPISSDIYGQDGGQFRGHLGASIIGRNCPRDIWYSFRWFKRSWFEGRMLRLFNRGHMEEPRLIALLVMIGCEVWQLDADGRQYRITDTSGHFGGSTDAIIRGIPESPEDLILSEFKTHGLKSFNKLVEQGVKAAKPEHYAQMQQYMVDLRLSYGLYMAVCKDDDRLHIELISVDLNCYNFHRQRASYIIQTRTPPPKINSSPGYYLCKFCSFKAVCHLNEAPERNCRTCTHSYPFDGGIWICNNGETPHYGAFLSEKLQESGCPGYSPLIVQG